MSGAGDRRVPLDLNGLTKIAETLEFDCCCAVHQRSDETFRDLHELAHTQTPATNGPSSGRSARSTIRASPGSSAQIITTPTIARSALTRELRFPSLETSRDSSLQDSAHQPEVKLMSTRHLYRYRNRLILSGAVNIVLFLAVIELSLWAVTKCPCKDGPPHPSVFSKGDAETRNDDIMNNSASTWRGIQHIPLSGPAAVTKCSCKDGQPQPSASSKEGEFDGSRKDDIMNSSVAEWRKIQPITVHSPAAAAVKCPCKGGAETKDDIMNSSVPDWRDIQPISFPSPAGTVMVSSELQKAVADKHSLNTTTGSVTINSEHQKTFSDKPSLNTSTAAVTVSYEHQNTTPDHPSLNTSTGTLTITSEYQSTVLGQHFLNTTTGKVTNTSENVKTVPAQPSLNTSTESERIDDYEDETENKDGA
ncbi:uncharacterized protein [Ambystoma mexicanum]|uniref:uncharacterized protein isoform X2 n=1 Tax=Ambystoma mexicanum TaxID=8296 RepID=UPI0037E97FB6